MYTVDEGKLIFNTPNVGGGLVTDKPMRDLEHNQFTGLLGVRVQQGKLVTGKIKTDSINAIGYPIYGAIPYLGGVPSMVLLGINKAWAYGETTPTEITPSPAFSTAAFTSSAPPNWTGDTIQTGDGDILVVCNGQDRPHYWVGTDAAMVIIDSSPFISTCTGFWGRLIGGAVLEGGTWLGNRLTWSAEGNITGSYNWSHESWGFLDLPDEYDRILRLARFSRTQLIAFRSRSAYSINPLRGKSSKHPFGSHELVGHVPLFAPRSLQNVRGKFLYLGKDDVYMADMDSCVSVGTPIRKALLASAEPFYLQNAWSFLDALDKMYYLVVQSTDYSLTAWIYNYEEGVWSTQSMTGYTMVTPWFGEPPEPPPY